MVKRYVFLLMLLCVCVSVGAMDMSSQPQGYRIMPLDKLEEVLKSPTAHPDDVIIYSTQDKQGIVVEKDVYEKSETLKSMIGDLSERIISFNITDEIILSSDIKQTFDILKLYNPQQKFKEREELITLKTSNILFTDFGKIAICMEYLLVDKDLLAILQEVFKKKIIQYFKAQLIRREIKAPIVLYDYEKGINVVAFSPDDKLIAAGGFYFQGKKNFIIKDIRSIGRGVFNISDFPVVLDVKLPTICSLDFFSNTQIDVGLSGDNNNLVSWSDISEKDLRSDITIPVQMPFVTKHIAEKGYFFGRGKKDSSLLFGSVDGIFSKDFASLAREPLGDIKFVTINPTGRLLASVSSHKDLPTRSKMLFLWNTKTEENGKITYNTRYNLRSELKDIHSIAFSPDGNWLIAAGATIDGSSNKKNMALFSVDNVWKQRSLNLDAIKQFGDVLKVNVVDFSADSEWIISAGDEYIALWDVRTGELLNRIEIGRGINSVALSHNCRMLLAGCRSAESSLLLWELFTQQELDVLEHIKHYNDEQLVLLYRLCCRILGDKTFVFDKYSMQLFDQLDITMQYFLRSMVPNLVDIIKDYRYPINIIQQEEPVQISPPPIVRVEEPEPEGWTWKQRAAIALGIGAAAAVAIIKGPQAYEWYQKWNKMKR